MHLMFKNIIIITIFFTPNLYAQGDSKPDYLNDLINIKSINSSSSENTEKLRLSAMKDAALSYGMKGALYWNRKNINSILEQNKNYLDRIFNFKYLLIRGPDNTIISPPIITEIKNTWETEPGYKNLRTADKALAIIEQEKFIPVEPIWQNFLIRNYASPKLPPNSLIPKNSKEKLLWKKWIKEGWKSGLEQSYLIFQHDLNRLVRDILGMIRYYELSEKNIAKRPFVSKSQIGSTGNGKNLRINDRIIRITRESLLNINSKQWTPLVK